MIRDASETQLESEREKYRGLWFKEKSEAEEREEQLKIDKAVEGEE